MEDSSGWSEAAGTVSFIPAWLAVLMAEGEVSEPKELSAVAGVAFVTGLPEASTGTMEPSEASCIWGWGAAGGVAACWAEAFFWAFSSLFAWMR